MEESSLALFFGILFDEIKKLKLSLNRVEIMHGKSHESVTRVIQIHIDSDLYTFLIFLEIYDGFSGSYYFQ